MPTQEALRLAQERGLDLVEVGPTSQPPVCKILDFGAYQYRQEKQARKQKAHARQIEIKGIRLSVNIGQHDREFRLKQAQKFFSQGHKVKLEVMLRGRENARPELARLTIEQFIADLNAKIEQPLNRQGKKFFVLISA